jgi:hypothetical protein
MTPEECGKTSLPGWDRRGCFVARHAGADAAGVGVFAGAHALGSDDVVFLTFFM